MKRGFALTLFLLATSWLMSAQIHGVPPSVTSFGPGRGPNPGVPASITSLGPNGFFGNGFFDGRFGRGFGFHHSPFSNHFHRHRFWNNYPVIWGGYYWPYYGLDNFGFDNYDPNAYQQQPAQPTVIVVDPKSSDDRYGDHTFAEERSSPPVRAQTPPSPPEEQEPTVLIFRDGHKQEVRNYAIVGQTLWDFGGNGLARKIPLSEIDLDSTRKVNDERGIEFVLPKS